MRLLHALFLAPLCLGLTACGPETAETVEDLENNPFLQMENEKEDTAYLNPSGIEVEVDLEADVATTSSRVRTAPVELGQFALTYLRKRGDFYLESLAEHASSLDRVEWRVDGVWKTARQAADVATSKLTHFRIRGVNAVLLNRAVTGVQVGKQFTAVVPRDPFNLMAEAGNTCAEFDNHMPLDASIYWYLWDPDLESCSLRTQDMTVTVSKLLPRPESVYPEYDQLVADKKITAVILFGQIDDGALTDYDPGMRGFNQVASWLKGAKYGEVVPAPVGRRFSKKFGEVTMEIDLYSPRDFAGLGDMAHFSNLQKAISEHEIVAYDGHSMLGASDFWSRPRYPSNYQIYLYGGCLGYEYYVKPIMDGKGGWPKLDLMSSVVEVTANAHRFAVPVLGKISYALTHNYNQSWQSILGAVRRSVGDSTFGVSGVRDNCFSPKGSRCQ